MNGVLRAGSKGCRQVPRSGSPPWQPAALGWESLILASLPDSAMDSATTQPLGELSPGAMQPGLDGADRPCDRLGDLFVRQILFVEQDEDQAIFRPEVAEGPLQLAGQVVGVGECGPGVGPFLDRLRRRDRRSAATERSAPYGSDSPQSPAARDGAAGRCRTPRSREGAEERLLDDVLRILSVAHHAVTQAEDHPLVSLDQQARRLRITSPQAPRPARGRPSASRHPGMPPLRPWPEARPLPILPQTDSTGFTIRSIRMPTSLRARSQPVASGSLALHPSSRNPGS